MEIGEKIKHLAIIPDGNRRWAKERGLPSFAGHKRGADMAGDLIEHAWEKGVHTVTLWGLSTDNFDKRPKEELKYLLELLSNAIDRFEKGANKWGARIIHLGRKDRLGDKLVEKLKKVEESTKKNTKHILNLAFDYGGRDEIVRAAKKIALGAKTGEIDPEKIDEEFFTESLDTNGQKNPCPDLIVRTSGEERLSGYLPWQSCHAEIKFERSFFPDFSTEKLDSIFQDFLARERRLGA